ncbi:YjbF family lipoprotein [Yoonia sp.]|uniref:YjbF family lipoprotein n=1 Tax=Yoonia sp. TaxID=2212373 RepID=UPI001A0DE775|nr:YjbF family lipoprotein [Yoonia sp.]MBE0414329.1 YjbF family lipoprotein [Yoonia sp.]
MKINSWICAAAAMALVACGPLNEDTAASRIMGQATARIMGTPPPASTGLGITQEQVLANPGQFMRVNIRNFDQWDTMAQTGQNGRRVTWVNGNNISLTLQDGIMVATRGLPRDLMGAETAETRQAIRAGGGIAQRTHEYITDVDAISSELLQCRIASQGAEAIEMLHETHNSVRFEEKCAGEKLEFTNVYWVNARGTIIRSLQAVSPDAGYLQIDVF